MEKPMIPGLEFDVKCALGEDDALIAHSMSKGIEIAAYQGDNVQSVVLPRAEAIRFARWILFAAEEKGGANS